MIKKYIWKLLVNQLSKLQLDVNVQFEQKEWKKIATRFLTLGNNVEIQYPYLITNPNFISIGDNFKAKDHLRLEAINRYGDQIFDAKIIIGSNVTMEFNCHIGSINRISIGDNVLIASNVFISDASHGSIKKEEINIPPALRALNSKGEINIGKNVWIGDSVCILSGISIGENTIVGANSVVTKSFPSNVVIGGVPARIIKKI